MIDNSSTPNIEAAELAQLREQYRLLQEKVNGQRIVTDAMIHDIISNKAGYVRRMVHNYAILGVVAIVLWILISVAFHLSTAFAIATIVLMAGDMIMDQWVVRPLRYASDPDVSIIDMADNAQKSIRRLGIDMVIGLAAIIPWLIWTIWEFLNIDGQIAEFLHPGVWVVGVCVGGVMGLFVGWFYYKKIRSALAGLVSQIDEYRKLQ